MQKPNEFQGRRLLLPLIVLIPMVVSALVLAGVLYPVTLLVGVKWYVWIIISPLAYIAWLMLFLQLSGGGSRRIGARHPKPRYTSIDLSGSAESLKDRGTLTVIACMTRAAFVPSLPLVHGLEQFSWFRKLVLRSYSPTIHVGKDALVWGTVMDPDLTEIGDKAVIGWSAEVIAHSLTSRPDGSVAYASAPIRIGARATIGGSAYVSLGCVIGEGAVVEPMSYVAPFTVIPPGETWGGSPARRVRGGETQAPIDSASTASVPDADLDKARKLVAFALGLPASDRAVWSAASCKEWDSLGQVAIAAALFDVYGVSVGSERLFRLRTIPDVAHAISGQALTNPEDVPVDPNAYTLPDDVEMAPLGDPAAVTRELTTRFLDRPAATANLRVVIASSFTAEPLATTMKVWGRLFGLEIVCEFAGFGQVGQTLLAVDSPFANNQAGVNVVLVDPTDRIFDSREQASSGMNELLGAIEAWRSRQPSGAQTLVGTLPPPVSAFATLDRTEYERLRQRWRDGIETMSPVRVFDFAAVVEQLGLAARNSQGEAFARMPYSPAMYQALSIALIREILATRRSPAKVIAVDCDNTLWGGVVGEVGVDGIEVGSDGHGRSFQLFQKKLKRLQERGLLLVVVSRNEEADVMRVFRDHPGMVLRPDDIAAWSVNWKSKAENLQDLAAKLNLGVDSFVFLDDDPAIRMEVTMRVPGIHVVPLPADPALYCETLERLWLFDGAQTTETDGLRTRMMQDESRREQEMNAAASLEEYLAGLRLEIEVREPLDTEWPRLAQLTQRTNQFNLSLRRRTLEEVRALAASTTILVLKARDRFGDYGLVGTCILQNGAAGISEIDTLLMSCRALGRGAEDAFLHRIAQAAVRQGSRTLSAPFVDGPRNRVIKEFIERKGFQETQPGQWMLALEPIPPSPEHVQWTGLQKVVEPQARS